MAVGGNGPGYAEVGVAWSGVGVPIGVLVGVLVGAGVKVEDVAVREAVVDIVPKTVGVGVPVAVGIMVVIAVGVMVTPGDVVASGSGVEFGFSGVFVNADGSRVCPGAIGKGVSLG